MERAIGHTEPVQRNQSRLAERRMRLHQIDVIRTQDDDLALGCACRPLLARGSAQQRVRVLPESRIPQIDDRRLRHEHEI
jgi:hypothetical protein